MPVATETKDEPVRTERPDPAKAVVQTTVLSHGTLECRDLAASRKFYEEFLGLETVFHGRRSILIRKGGYWGVVCVKRGDAVKPVGVLNHWGVDVATRAEVDAAREKAIELKDVYGIRDVHQPREQHGVYSFYLQDLDGNWWEIQSVPEVDLYDKLFERGDRAAL
ncbi:MAG: VOC family protein [Alphaproteobacteria bacterium]|nr:VOC family protein [Alphaproteobacteria bacterium]